MLTRLLIAALVLAVANALVLGVRAWWAFPVRVGSESMQPALAAGDRLIVMRRVGLDDLERGDIVVVALASTAEGPRPATGDDRVARLVVKRVVGLPGETIQGAEQVVAVSRTDPLREPWARWGQDDSRFGPLELAADEVYVLGDTRDRSEDSRRFGAVPAAALRGRAALRVWPPSDWGRP